jgi:minimal PKS chain-length factor (CLF/KS beta)
VMEILQGRPERALITGIAAIAPNGADTGSFWRATCEGVGGIGPITRFDAGAFPVRLAGEVSGIDLGALVEGRLAAQTDRWSQFGLAAAGRALEDAGVVPQDLPGYSMAVITASSSGGNEFGQREIEKLWSKGPKHVGPYQSIAWFYAATTGQISINEGMKGPCGVVVAEQAGGIDVFAHARRALHVGDASVVLTGGVEAPIGPYALACQLSSGLLSRSKDPELAYRPFHADADGYVPGEGGAMLIMESESAARRRGVERPYGEVAGYGASFDPAPGSSAPPGLARAITTALQQARLGPQHIDVVYADGLGLPLHDQHEAEAITAVFGPRGVPVTAPKCLYGRLYAGGAPLDVTCALLSMRDSVIAPTPATDTPAYPIDLVTTARRQPVRTALVLARGYGGFNSALVLRAV